MKKKLKLRHVIAGWPQEGHLARKNFAPKLLKLSTGATG